VFTKSVKSSNPPTLRREPALLGIYLNDHLAAATGELELARRAAGARRVQDSERDVESAVQLTGLAEDIAEDRAALIGIVRALGFPIRRYKVYLAWTAEKAGRLKLNGHVLSRSPLSDIVELEALRLSVDAKAAAWRTLRALAETDRRLNPAQLDELIARAQRQSDALEQLRLQACARVFGGPARFG
jgi:hypothetical protein